MRGIHDPRLIAAIRAVPADAFGFADAFGQLRYARVPETERRRQPPVIEVIAQMIQALELSGSERVLELGTGNGYPSALLGRLARDVYSIERDRGLADLARTRLQSLGIGNVHVVEAEPIEGWAAAAPYHAILVRASLRDVPDRFVEQLEEGGRLVIPLGDSEGQLVERWRRQPQSVETETITWCRLEPLQHTGGQIPSRYPWARGSRRTRTSRA